MCYVFLDPLLLCLLNLLFYKHKKVLLMGKKIVENIWNGDIEAQSQAAMKFSRKCFFVSKLQRKIEV